MQQLDLDIEGAVAREPAVLPSAFGSDLPLAARMRPRTLEEYAGQRHLLGEGKLLRRAIDADQFTSIIFSGPPGIGKTSLSELIAQNTNSEFVRLSGVTSTVADVRREIAYAVQRRQISGRKTILFIDEIHRFNKAQQDVLLPDVENGNVRLVGATTENPFFYVNRPLLSRSMLFQLEALDREDIIMLLRRACTDPRGFPGRKIELPDDAADFLADICEGDARKALSAFELAVMTTQADADGVARITVAIAEASIQKKAISYGDDGHYDTASAFIKSMRGSDPDAAIYWLAKMLHAGEDINFIARRIVIFASEDIGNADPRAITVAVNAMQGVQMIGLPEAKLILAQAVTYCATAPKSNASCKAIGAALEDIAKERVQPVPIHLRDSHSDGGKTAGNGQGYLYPHSFGGFVDQDYLGIAKTYYCPVDTGYESKIRERLQYWSQCRKEMQEHADDRK